MRKIFYTSLCFLLFLTATRAQKKTDLRLMEKTYKVTRISLREKINLPARDLPSQIIRAYCEGNIVGYYPQKPNVVCSYHEFTDHFGVNKVQPPEGGDAFEEVNCPQAFCYTKNEASIEPFRLYLDLFETRTFSRETSTENTCVQYIRLNFVTDRHGMEIIMDGPLFLYDDLVKLNSSEYSLPNPKNDAARVSIKQFFQKRMFHGFPLKTDTRPYVQPAETEKDKWHH